LKQRNIFRKNKKFILRILSTSIDYCLASVSDTLRQTLRKFNVHFLQDKFHIFNIVNRSRPFFQSFFKSLPNIALWFKAGLWECQYSLPNSMLLFPLLHIFANMTSMTTGCNIRDPVKVNPLDVLIYIFVYYLLIKLYRRFILIHVLL
jgi:hypothetical protein